MTDNHMNTETHAYTHVTTHTEALTTPHHITAHIHVYTHSPYIHMQVHTRTPLMDVYMCICIVNDLAFDIPYTIGKIQK